MSLKIVKYIKLDDQKGALYSAGKQSLLIPVGFIKTLHSMFLRLVGERGASILIYKIGEALGKEYVQTLETILKEEKRNLSSEMKIRINCNAISMEAGWGRIEIQKIDLSNTILEIKINFSPSGEFLQKSEYDLERGIFAGVYREITKEEVYCQLVNKDKRKHIVVLKIVKDIPREIKEQERLILLTRRELEQKIKQTTQELRKRINELERFHRLTVGRELRMIELKKEIKKLKEELKETKASV